MAQSVYYFGQGQADGNATMKNLLGGKGANLAEMTKIGLPVPSGFTITADECLNYLKTGEIPESPTGEGTRDAPSAGDREGGEGES